MKHWILVAALLLQSVTKDDVLRLAKDGVKEEEILKKIDGVRFKLSADDIIELKKAGVTEKVIARMIDGPREVKAVNLAHKDVTLRVNGRTIEIGVGDRLAPGGAVELAASGEYAVTVNGRETSCKVKTPATLTFRGSDQPDFEIVTLYLDDAKGSDTCLVELRVKK